MIQAIDTIDEFATSMLRGVAETVSMPQTIYNSDGDCIEYLRTSESYYAERVDDRLTVYYGQESGEIIGSLFKGVTPFVRDVLRNNPGFAAELQDGRLLLTHLFTAGMWQLGEKPLVKAYRSLRESSRVDGASVCIPMGV